MELPFNHWDLDWVGVVGKARLLAYWADSEESSLPKADDDMTKYQRAKRW